MDARLSVWLQKLANKQFVTRPQVPSYALEAVEALLFQGALRQHRVNGVLRYEVTDAARLAAFGKEV